MGVTVNYNVGLINMKMHPMSVRLEPHVRDALERAALDDRRNLSAMIDVILVRWLESNGYLPASPRNIISDRE